MQGQPGLTVRVANAFPWFLNGRTSPEMPPPPNAAAIMLDFNTLLTLNFIVNIINLLTMAILWRRFANKFQGLSFWLAHMAVHVAGIGLVLLRATLPSLATVVGGNLLLMSSTLFMLMGMERFTDRVTRQWPNALAFGVYAALLYFFTEIKPDIVARTICGSAFIVFIDVQTCWLLFWRASPGMRRITFLPGVVMLGYVATSLARIAILTLIPPDSGLARAGLADSVAVTSYLSLHIGMMISLAMTLTRRLLDEVLAQEEKFAKAFHSSPYALVIARREDGRIIEVNNGFSDIFGYSRQEALGRTLAELRLLPPGSPPQAHGYEIAATDDGNRREIHVARKSGEPMVGQLSSETLVINGEECVLSSIADITEENLLKQKLQELAVKDSLTGLPNRRFLAERFEIARLDATRRRTRMAVLSIDLDRFKSVNDGLGHAAGDAVLVEAAGRLTGCLRKVDVVARFGGDEFVILLTEVGGIDDASRVAEKIVEQFRVPFDVQGTSLAISASIGIAVYPDNGQDLSMLLKGSDEALYTAKHAGRDGFSAIGS